MRFRKRAVSRIQLPARDFESVSRSIPVGSINELLFGSSLEIREENGIAVDGECGKVHVFLKSSTNSAKCPRCGMVSDKFHCVNSRNPQWMPINGMTTYAHIELNRFRCTNINCPQKTFTEELDSAKSSQQRSDLVNVVVFAVSVFCSDVATAMICGEMGIYVSHDSVNRLLDHIIIEDDPDIEFIGVDDVSQRKGQKYNTVIYSGEDHHLLAMLPGRDGNAFREWLKTHKKIKIVARDRASAYASAISDILPDAVQVADRFHILQNLLDYLNDIFNANMPKQIFIRNGEVLDEPPEKVCVPKVPLDSPELDEINYENTPPVDENGQEIAYCNKKRDERTKNYKLHEENRKQKYKKIVELRKKWASSPSCTKKQFAAAHGISVSSLTKYLNMTDEQVEDILNIKEYKKRKTDMDDYMNIVFKMLSDGYRPEFIYSYILHIGYEGSHKSLTGHIEAIARNNFEIRVPRNFYMKEQYPDDVVVVSRGELLKYITAKDKNKYKDTAVAIYYEVIRQKYPVIDVCSEIWGCFYPILMGDDPNKLDDFVAKYEDSAISSFVAGIKKDITPVKNAISLPVSSGFVEGGNCRYKATERLMFGRSGLNHLFNKAYAISIIMRTEKTASSLLEIWLKS